MKKTFNLMIIAILIIISGCAQSDKSLVRIKKAREQKKVLTIGVGWPLSDYAQTFKNGMSLALEEINKAEKDFDIKLIFKDDKSNVTDGMRVANEFSENTDVVAVIGHRNSYITMPVSNIYRNAGILMVTPGSTNPEIIDEENPLAIRTIPSDHEFGKQAAVYAKNMGYKKVLIYYEKNDYGRALANSFEDKCEENSIKIMDRRAFLSGSLKEFLKDLEYWDLIDFDAIFMASVMPAAPEFIIQLRKKGFDQPVFGGDGLDHNDLIRIGKESVEGTVALSVFNPYSQNKKTKIFVEKYKKEFGSMPDMWAAQAYDTLKILYQGAKNSKTFEPLKISEEIKKLEKWEGVSGKHSFTENGELKDKKVVIKQVINGKFMFKDAESGGTI